jgi:hypothetical protein
MYSHPRAHDARRIDALPRTIKHIVVITTVPVVFPKLPLSEVTMTLVDKLPLLKGESPRSYAKNPLFA